MLRCGGSSATHKHRRRDVVAGHRLRAAIERLRRRLVAAHAHQREFGLDHAGLDRGDAHAGAVQIAAQPERELLHERLGPAIDVAAGIGIGRGDRRDVDDRAAPGDQPRQQFVGERSERRHIGVDHRFPLGEIGRLRGISAKREPGVVDREGRCREIRWEARPAPRRARPRRRRRRPRACTLSAPMAATSASSRSARRPVATTRHPAAANARAAASPMPEVAPVMRAVLLMLSPSKIARAGPIPRAKGLRRTSPRAYPGLRS